MKAYRMKNDSKIEPKAKAGILVYDQSGHDYGLASDDSRILGYPCKSVTLNENGDYPGFVVPVHDLEVIE